MAKSKSIIFLLTLALIAVSTGRAFAAAWDDDDLQQRQQAMGEAVHMMYNYDHGHDAVETVQRAMGVVNGELALLRPIFDAVSKMPEGSAAEDRAKEKARAAAVQLLTRHFDQLLPGSSAKMVEL